VRHAEKARDAGCESVWFHESYFERDAVTYSTAVAARVRDIGIALGALSTYARPTALTAMTVSALDDNPGRPRLTAASASTRRRAAAAMAKPPGRTRRASARVGGA
jgi:alkanesulfonate monooxygenase SsuD/methylene tetrahydromethanopterin reductase-like flavin-dependent oxidoreductase (luciferase family)